jgi:serine/threonine-protein kinase HipA
VQAAIEDHSGSPDADLNQLWLRIAFSVAIHNTDDHLRNHGFLHSEKGWRLSPAFDVNPNPEVGLPRATPIGGETMQRGELAALIGLADYFGLSQQAARRSIVAVFEATADWRSLATSNGVPESELRRFEGAFDGLRDEAMSL